MRFLKRKKLLAVSVGLALLGAAALSAKGRSEIKRVVSSLTSDASSNISAETTVANTQSTLDVEGRARQRHGWGAGIENSVVHGAIRFFDRNGGATGEAQIVIYRRYPDRLRVVLTRGASVEAMGFDQISAWSSTGGPNERQARDIRQWLRIGPERLFVTRGSGAVYREAGSRREDSKPGSPWQGPAQINPPVVLEQVQMEDTLGPPPNTTRSGDRRFVTYYVNQSNFTIESARWLEPDDPRRSAGDRESPTTDVRVDFGDWRTASGVLWPFEIVHWQGGRVDYRIVVIQVQINQSLSDTLFQRP
jgi:hypothetical protein